MNLLKSSLAAGVLLVCTSIFAEETKGEMVVKGTGFKNEKGGAILYLYRKKDNIREEGFIKVKSEIKESKCNFNLKNIEFGEYGIKVIHDENSNEKMDAGIFGVEGVGFAKNVKINRGLQYEDIKVIFGSTSAAINVEMKYPTMAEIILENPKTK